MIKDIVCCKCEETSQKPITNKMPLKDAKGICNIILMSRKFGGLECTSEHDPNGYYTDINDCINHFINVYPLGIADALLPANTSTCRYFYVGLVGAAQIIGEDIDVAPYCTYVGKTGGNKCTDYVNVDLHFHKLPQEKIEAYFDKLQKEYVVV